ncbi:hypothetical protein [Paenibacillus lycopersici]|uniref:hypothetical protein n=1 Tax=Paenibacillus lycopersici TaxID=2704462 RepID=UPI00177D6489|nr:hypothetical protein [Paenibacillus lycopersici]
MLGAIIGDVIGSVFEWHNNKSTEFSLFNRFTRFTDDTVLTIAIADAVLSRQKHKNQLFDYFAGKKLTRQAYALGLDRGISGEWIQPDNSCEAKSSTRALSLSGS